MKIIIYILYSQVSSNIWATPLSCGARLELRKAPILIERISRAIMGCDPAHGWPHIVRVYRLSYEILNHINEPVKLDVLETAVLLHDVGRFLPGDEHHALKSAHFARELLGSIDIRIPVNEVEHAILSHSYSLGIKPRTIEAKILSDADKLDALGAVGIARVIHVGCLNKRSFEESVNHFYEKILKLPNLLHLDYSKKLAEERLRIVEDFLRSISLELELNRI